MIEVVFSKSAQGSVRLAAEEAPGGPALLHSTHACAGPGAGAAIGQVFCFALGHSMGDISGDGISQARLDSIAALFSPFEEDIRHAQRETRAAAGALDRLTARMQAGEPVRIWYSDAPDEACGLCWLLEQLSARCGALSGVQAVELPHLLRRGDSICQPQGWGELPPQTLAPLARDAVPVTAPFVTMAVTQWRQLREENAPLRAVINGRLCSVPIDFYDPFLLAQLDRMEDRFPEPQLIGAVMARCQLGVGDLWIALRIEQLIRDGRLRVAGPPAPGRVTYRRELEKIK